MINSTKLCFTCAKLTDTPYPCDYGCKRIYCSEECADQIDVDPIEGSGIYWCPTCKKEFENKTYYQEARFASEEDEKQYNKELEEKGWHTMEVGPAINVEELKRRRFNPEQNNHSNGYPKNNPAFDELVQKVLEKGKENAERAKKFLERLRKNNE